MKTILLFLLFTVPVLAQNGFRTEKGKIIWEYTFSDATNIRSVIEGREKMKIVVTEESFYTGKAEGVKNDTDVNSQRLKSDANFDFTVTKVAGGYKVKVSNFVLLEKCGPMQMRIIPASLDKYYLEHGKIRNSEKTTTDLGYVANFLTAVFTQKAAVAENTALTAK